MRLRTILASAAVLTAAVALGVVIVRPEAVSAAPGGNPYAPTGGGSETSNGYRAVVNMVRFSGNAVGSGPAGGGAYAPIYVPCWWDTSDYTTGQSVYDEIQQGLRPDGRVSGGPHSDLDEERLLTPPPLAEVEAHRGDTAATPGAWYYRTCISPPDDSVMTMEEWDRVANQFFDVNTPFLQWVDPGQNPPPPAVSAQTLRAFAEQRLELRMPEITRSPNGDAIVNLSTWFWGSPASFADPLWVRAEIPGVAFAQVNAHPARMDLSSNDGQSAECVNPVRGTEWSPALGEEATSECSLTFPRMATYQVTAETTYNADWQGNGITGPQGGALAPRTGPTFEAQVRAIETQVVGSGQR
jgi:hypothetical protein